MLLPSRKNTPALLESAAAALAGTVVLLLALMPGARLVGVFLALSSGVLFSLAQSLANSPAQRTRWLRTPLDLPILLILFQMGLSLWATPLPDKTTAAACQLASGLVAYYAVVNWARDRVRLWWTVVGLIALGAGLALVSPFVVDWFRNVKTFLPASLFRLFPLLVGDTVHPNVMAAALVTLVPLSLALLLAPRRTVGQGFWPRTGLAAACLVQVVVVVLTKSRGGYLALAVGIWLTLWLSGRRRLAVGLAIVALPVLVGMALLSAGNGGEGLSAARAAADASTWAFRQRIWQVAIRIIRDFSLTGTGMGAFNDVADFLYGLHVPQNPQAHNLFLQVAVDLGLPGLISFLAILLLALWAGLQSRRLLGHLDERPLQAAATGGLSGLLAAMVHGLVDSHTWGSKGAFLLWAVMGLVIALHLWALAPEREGTA